MLPLKISKNCKRSEAVSLGGGYWDQGSVESPYCQFGLWAAISNLENRWRCVDPNPGKYAIRINKKTWIKLQGSEEMRPWRRGSEVELAVNNIFGLGIHLDNGIPKNKLFVADYDGFGHFLVEQVCRDS